MLLSIPDLPSMDFLKKAKAQLEEAQADLSKAAASLGNGDRKLSAPASFSAAAPSSDSTPINTPATSAAPSTVGAPKAKLPLAIRKNGTHLLLLPLLLLADTDRVFTCSARRLGASTARSRAKDFGSAWCDLENGNRRCLHLQLRREWLPEEQPG